MSINESKQKWNEKVGKGLAKSPERTDKFLTSSNIEMERCFTPGFDYPGYEEQLGFPGEYPYTRGVQPTMYRGRFWTMRQYAGFGTAKESNERYKYLLSAGQTGLSIAFDLPTQMGYDSDAGMSLGEVGKVGVAIDSLADMEILFDGIPLDKVSTSMTINSTAAILLCMYIAVAEKQGVSADKISGTIQNDILKEYMARGTYIYPAQGIDADHHRHLRLLQGQCPEVEHHLASPATTSARPVPAPCRKSPSPWPTASPTSRPPSRPASTSTNLRRASPSSSTPTTTCFEEVAKFRAARRMWAKIMTERFGAKDPKSQMLRFHTQTAGCTLTAQQPDNNIMRVTMQALAAVLGGTQSLHTNSRDEALALPTEDSVRIALRTQQVIAYESGAADTIDPLAGSFLVESLTDQIEKDAPGLHRKDRQAGRGGGGHLARLPAEGDPGLGLRLPESRSRRTS